MKPTHGLNKKQCHVISELDKLAKKAGLKVSAGKLDFAGLKLRSGRCLLRQEDWLVVDRLQSFEDQVELYRRALSEVDIPSGQLETLSQETKAFLARDRAGGRARMWA
jgi:hypothetical protein